MTPQHTKSLNKKQALSRLRAIVGAKINRWGEYFRPSHLYTQILALVLGTKALQIWRVSAGTKQKSWSVPSSITMFIVKRRLWLFFANINRVIGSTTFSKHVFYEQHQSGKKTGFSFTFDPVHSHFKNSIFKASQKVPFNRKILKVF